MLIARMVSTTTARRCCQTPLSGPDNTNEALLAIGQPSSARLLRIAERVARPPGAVDSTRCPTEFLYVLARLFTARRTMRLD